jgi:fused signal recognition particle receptor
MVFNWFQRKFGKSSPQEELTPTTESLESEETPSEAEEKAESTSDSSQDYLSWAKAAYQNIQARQQVETSVPDAEETQVESATASEVKSEPVDLTAAVESTEAEPEVTEVESSPDTSAEQVGENLEPVSTVEPEPSLSEAESETVRENLEPVTEEPPLETVTENTEPVAEAESEVIPEHLEPVLEEEQSEPVAENLEPINEVEPVVETIETPVTESEPILETAPLPFWATEDRQARLDRLKETVSAPEEKPDRVASVSTPEVTKELEQIAFDEGFLWSAEVLAAQGRRPEEVSLEEISWLKRLRQGLEKTRRGLINQLKSIVGQGPLNQAAVAEVEALLLQADVGIEATDAIVSRLQNKLKQETLPPDAAIAYLKQILREMLESPFQKDYQPTFVPEKDTLNIWLLTGVNGVGKTTTIGKIAHLAQKSGYKCLIGAADTFRAAAVEQVKIWGERSGIEVIANPGQNVDPAAVVFDSITAAQSRGTELLLVDTAGRLQNKKNLMEELGKIRRIVDKKAPNARIESLLVLDSTLGQNGLRQAQVFAEAAKLSGVVITKLDGTAKGGIALAVVKELGLPIRFIGAGEGIEDLRPFSSYEFVEALLNG